MTTEEKLIALGFEQSKILDVGFSKYINIREVDIFLYFNIKKDSGNITNLRSGFFRPIDNFTQLLKWNDFYEKQAKRIARRNEGRDGSETQNQFHQAH